MILDSGLIAYTNAFIIIVLILMTVIGYFSGVVKQLVGFFSFTISIIIALLFSPGLAKLFSLADMSFDSIASIELVELLNYKLNSILWFVLLFIITYILLTIIVKAFDVVMNLPVLKLFNRVLGAILGFIKACLILLIVSIILSSPIFINGSEFKEKTFFTYIDATISSNIVSDVLNEGKALQDFLVNPESVTDTQVDWIEKWLIESGYSVGEVQEIIDSMMGS